jgi:hypothetical protein
MNVPDACPSFAPRCTLSLRSLFVALPFLLHASSALAEATVVVEVKRADGSSAEGVVQLTKGETKYSCTTAGAGRCEIRGVAGGMYSVLVEQSGRPASKPKSVVIPPNGEVKLIVNAN